MKIALTSDIHEYLPDIKDVDMAIFAGDFAYQDRGDIDGEVKLWNTKLIPYMQKLRKRKIKLVGCPGNHDFLCDNYSLQHIVTDQFDLFLRDGFAQLEGLTFAFFAYCQLEFWAMFKPVDRQKAYCDWMNINAINYPKIDILVTHTPPLNILSEEDWGSYNIEQLAFNLKPDLHVFGHVHECFGDKVINGIQFVNAAFCGIGEGRYFPRNKYFVWDTQTKELEVRQC